MVPTGEFRTFDVSGNICSHWVRTEAEFELVKHLMMQGLNDYGVAILERIVGTKT